LIRGCFTILVSFVYITKQQHQLPKMRAIKLICLVFIFAHSAYGGMSIISATDPNIVGDWNAVPNFFTNNPREWNISGELVQHWRAVNMDDLTGKWVLVPRPQRWIWDQIAVPLQEKGCIGVVVSPHQYFRKLLLNF
jgi:hypothetical protein